MSKNVYKHPQMSKRTFDQGARPLKKAPPYNKVHLRWPGKVSHYKKSTNMAACGDKSSARG